MTRKKDSGKPSKSGKPGRSNSRSKPKAANADTSKGESLPGLKESLSTSPECPPPSSIASIECLLEQSGLTLQEAYIQAETERQKRLLASFRDDPVGYARQILGITCIWDELADVLRRLLLPPFRVSVDSGHNLGKTFFAAIAVNWWFDTRNPGVVITTAPTDRDVKDLLWTEVRLQRQRAGLSDCFIGPAAPEMRDGAEHYAKGYTARKGESFQGRHRPNQLFIFDEKEGVERNYWDAAKTMFRAGSGDAWLVIGNPTTTTSYAYQEHRATDAKGDPTWHRINLSSLNHPNITGDYPDGIYPVPGAVTPAQIDTWVVDWCEPVPQGDEQPTDILWRGEWYRPGPIGDPRIRGLRPSEGTFGVFSEAAWACTLKEPPAIPGDCLPVIGCDVANYGVDHTAFHVRAGAVSLFHQAVNGWSPTRVYERLIVLAREWAAWATKHQRLPQASPVNPGEIEIRIDDDGEGRTISDFLRKAQYRAVPVNASSTARRPDLYPNVRSELWFMAARKAAKGMLNVSRLDRTTRQRLEMQALAPVWWPTEDGRRLVESKDDLREPKRLGRSPDDFDGMALAYYEPSGIGEARWVEVESQPALMQKHEPADERRDVTYDEIEEYDEPRSRFLGVR